MASSRIKNCSKDDGSKMLNYFILVFQFSTGVAERKSSGFVTTHVLGEVRYYLDPQFHSLLNPESNSHWAVWAWALRRGAETGGGVRRTTKKLCFIIPAPALFLIYYFSPKFYIKTLKAEKLLHICRCPTC